MKTDPIQKSSREMQVHTASSNITLQLYDQGATLQFRPDSLSHSSLCSITERSMLKGKWFYFSSAYPFSYKYYSQRLYTRASK